MKGMICLLFLLCLPLSRAEKSPLSLAFDEAPVGQVFQALAAWKQLNLVVAPEVSGTLSVRLDNVAWEQAIALVARMAKVTIEQQENVLLVWPESRLLEQQRQLEKAREKAEAELPLITEVLTLAHADASTINSSLLAERAKLMSGRGSVTVDTRTNSLLLRETEPALEAIRRWVHALDVPLEQIELAAHIVTVNEESLRELGVRWGLSGEEQITRALRASQFSVNLPVTEAALTAGFTLARLDGRLLDLELNALEQENKLEIIASPRLFTSHQQTASIKQGTEIPYEVSSGNNGNTRVEFKEAVLGMEVTPVVQHDGRILLKLHLSQNVPGRTMRSGEGEYLAIDKQEIQTQVTLKDGQTLALGGIFQRENANGQRKVPLIGDIPIVGSLFRYDIHQQKRRELVIFITPRLIRDE